MVGAYLEDSTETTITNGTTNAGDGFTSSGAVYVFRRQYTSASPTVTSVTPTSGAIAGNNIVIYGTNFVLGATAKVGSAACTTSTVQSPNEIICTLPTNSAGAKAIQVTNPDASTSNTSITVTY